MLYCSRCRTLFHSENSDFVVSIFPNLYAPVAWHIQLMQCLLDNVLWAVTQVCRVHSGRVHYLRCWLVTSKLTQIHPHNFGFSLLKCATASTVLVWCCCGIILQRILQSIKRENMGWENRTTVTALRFATSQEPVALSGTSIIKDLVHTVEKQWFHELPLISWILESVQTIAYLQICGNIMQL